MSDNQKYTITQASKMTGYQSHVIRYYEKEFSIKIPRNKSNHRYFTNSEIEVLKTIKSLQERGYNNTQIKMILKSPDMEFPSLQDANNGIAVSTDSSKKSSVESYEIFFNTMERFKKDIIEEFRNQLDFYNQSFAVTITELAEEISRLSRMTAAKSEENEDTLLSENAKLKMQLRKTTYELLEIKEQLRKERERNQTFIGKVFKK